MGFRGVREAGELSPCNICEGPGMCQIQGRGREAEVSRPGALPQEVAFR